MLRKIYHGMARLLFPRLCRRVEELQRTNLHLQGQVQLIPLLTQRLDALRGTKEPRATPEAPPFARLLNTPRK